MDERSIIRGGGRWNARHEGWRRGEGGCTEMQEREWAGEARRTGNKGWPDGVGYLRTITVTNHIVFVATTQRNTS